ncbi:3211_t:CDS:2 [Funneliformis mosseae]|uniref:3211_t:CDS:1 n=1 Tax=Funneliformis mosseae TaxID=27381 RepID=A0A9N8W7U5_FUNMO|nr:3211_t:CDS:2 [Funneliformis mosseae]
MGKGSFTFAAIKNVIVVLNFLSLVSHVTSSTIEYHFPHVLISLGGLISLVSFLGCYGAANQKITFLKVYVISLFICIIFQIVIGSIAFAYHQEVDSILDKSWSKAFQDDKQLILDVENYFHCCGFNSLSDRVVLPCTYYTPCYESMKFSLTYSLQTIGIVGVVLGLLELICLLLAVVLIIHTIHIHRQEPDERQALLAETRRLDDAIRKTYERRCRYH